MSVLTTRRVWEGSSHSGSELLVLLAIADFADEAGENAFPSLATLAQKCRMKPRNARYCLVRLEESGELAILPNAGPRGVNRYRINLDRLSVQSTARAQPLAEVQVDALPLQVEAASAAVGCTSYVQSIAPEPSVNHHEPPKKHQMRSASRSAPMVQRPECVTEQTWGDWLQLRQGLKAAVTETVVAEAIREAGKAGVPLQRFLEIWCMRGTRGLQADWLRAGERGSAPAVASKHAGFAQKNYRDGIDADGSFH